MADYTITLTTAQETEAVLREGETLTQYCQRIVDDLIASSAAQALQKRFDAIGPRRAAMLALEEAR